MNKKTVEPLAVPNGTPKVLLLVRHLHPLAALDVLRFRVPLDFPQPNGRMPGLRSEVVCTSKPYIKPFVNHNKEQQKMRA